MMNIMRIKVPAPAAADERPQLSGELPKEAIQQLPPAESPH
jgi:hypothetical protein